MVNVSVLYLSNTNKNNIEFTILTFSNHRNLLYTMRKYFLFYRNFCFSKIIKKIYQPPKIMKTTTALLAIVLCICLLSPLFAQDETKGQLWYCYEETVKPADEKIYTELSKELLELCKQNDFPFPIYTWTPGEFKFQLWSPINTLNDIGKIEDEWNKIIESWDQEKYATFNKTKVKNRSFTCRGRKDLHYQPENPRYKMEDVTFSFWQEVLFKPEKVKEAEELMKKMNKLIGAKKYDNPMYLYDAGIGYETPMIIAVNYALDIKDHIAQNEKWNDFFTDDELKEIDELNSKVIACTQTIKIVRLWRLKDLTYEPLN